MGYQATDQSSSGDHSNTTAYVGNDVFGPLLRQLANQYGTQQAAADLIFGGKQYGKARTYLPDQYRDLSAGEAQSVIAAGNTNQATKKMPSYKDESGNVWAWDAESNIYIGYAPDKDNRYTVKIGAWSPYDKENRTPPWKGATPTPPPSAPSSPPPPTSAPPPSGGINGSTPPSSVAPKPVEGSQGMRKRVPGVGRADETGLTGLGVRTESPTTSENLARPSGVKGSGPVVESETDEFSRRFGQTPTGTTANYNPRSDNPFDAGDPNDRRNWDTNYDPRPSSRTLGKDIPTSDLASQHPATFRQAMDRIGEDPNYYQNPGAFHEPLAQGIASEGGDWLNMKRKPEEAAAQDTFAKLLSSLGRR